MYLMSYILFWLSTKSKWNIINSNGQIECIDCNITFALKDGFCLKCSTIQEIGGSGCDKCRYNYNSARYECINCINDNYAFIQNTYKCLLNSISTYNNIRGCLRANFNEKKIFTNVLFANLNLFQY